MQQDEAGKEKKQKERESEKVIMLRRLKNERFAMAAERKSTNLTKRPEVANKPEKRKEGQSGRNIKKRKAAGKLSADTNSNELRESDLCSLVRNKRVRLKE